MKTDDEKLLATTYLIGKTFTRQELMTLIVMLIDLYYGENKDESGHGKIKEFNNRRKANDEPS